MGRVRIYFSSKQQYYLGKCHDSRHPKDFTDSLPTTKGRVWKISLTKSSEIRVKIHCNEQRVVNLLLSDDNCDNNDWNKYWTRDVAQIEFRPGDSASKYYRSYTGMLQEPT